MKYAATKIAVTLFPLMFLFGCVEGKGPFLMVQICLGDEKNLAEFKRVLQAIAKSEHMEFRDNSADTQEGLKIIGAPEGASKVIHMWVRDANFIGVSASNLGLNTYQVGLGFYDTGSPNEERAFARKVLNYLEPRWVVITLPPGSGALPMKSCQT